MVKRPTHPRILPHQPKNTVDFNVNQLHLKKEKIKMKEDTNTDGYFRNVPTQTNGKLNTTTRAHNLDRTVINEQKGHSVSQSVKNLVNGAP